MRAARESKNLNPSPRGDEFGMQVFDKMMKRSLCFLFAFSLAAAPGFPGNSTTEPPNRVADFFEDPADMTSDDNDSNPTNATLTLSGSGSRFIDDVGENNATPIRGLSGLRWGGFNAATQATVGAQPDHSIGMFNLEGLAGEGTLR